MTKERMAWRGLLAGFLAGLLSLAAATAARAQQAPAAGPPDELEKLKSPAPWLSMNGDLRFREIFAPNMFLNKEDRHWQSYRGRIGVFELMVADAAIEEAIRTSGESVARLRGTMAQRGVSTLRDDAARKILRGETSIEEALHVLGGAAE